MFDRCWRTLTVWLTASSLLACSTAAIVHTHEHAGHEHAKSSVATAPAHAHSACKHHHHHAEPASKSEIPSHQHPTRPHSHDDCALCHFLLEHSLPPSHVELRLLDVVLELRPEWPRIVAVSALFDLPPARGPPGQA